MQFIDFFISPAYAAPATEGAAGGMFQLLLIAGMFIMFYVMLIRPQRKRQKELQSMLNQLSQGDEVATHAGILGKVKLIQGDFVILKVADNVELKFQKTAVNVVLPKGTIKNVQ